MEHDHKTRIRTWQTALLSAFVATGLVLVCAPQLAVGASGTSAASEVQVAPEPAPVDVPLVRTSAPAAQHVVKAPPPLKRKPVLTTPALVAGVTAPSGGTALAGGTEGVVARTQSVSPGPTTSFRVASINALGDSHTRPGGNKHGWASSATRTRNLLSILGSRAVDVVGLQEFEKPQKATFNQIAPAWDVFTGTERGHDSIAYRTDVWQYVTGGTGTIPYFHGNPAPMPWVTLRHIATGREVSFISIHNPTSNPKRGNNAGNRAEATRREIATVRSLAASGNPVMLLGDFNERDIAFCRVTAGGDIGAANGGSRGGSCAPPSNMGIDWIFGTTDIGFSEYLRNQDALVRRTTDHPVIVARASITEPLPTS
jgi:hypothetical protein